MTNDMAYGNLLPDQNCPKLQETRYELLDLQTGKFQENYASTSRVFESNVLVAFSGKKVFVD